MNRLIRPGAPDAPDTKRAAPPPPPPAMTPSPPQPDGAGHWAARVAAWELRGITFKVAPHARASGTLSYGPAERLSNHEQGEIREFRHEIESFIRWRIARQEMDNVT